jgi:NAD(P)-dependent dehydrogenase (short-subunit alcohol dehydrogenase family)
MSASRDAVETAMERFGRLDVLLNSAGYTRLSPFEQVSEDDFKAEIDTNFYGVVNLTRAALPVVLKQKSGHIINISSSSARFGSPCSPAYTAAKWAVSGFTTSLAKEVKPFGVKAVAIEPGSIRTNWTRVARSHVPPLLPEYEPTIGAIMRMTEGYAVPSQVTPTRWPPSSSIFDAWTICRSSSSSEATRWRELPDVV